MKMKLRILSYFFILSFCNIFGQVPNSTSVQGFKTDSVIEIANKFLVFDIYLNSFVVSDRDIEETYTENKQSIKNIFPSILNSYDLTLYSQFSIAIYLFIEGEKKYLYELWAKYGRLSGDESYGIYPTDEFVPILNLLKYYKINMSM
jgi:hypothetical protein